MFAMRAKLSKSGWPAVHVRTYGGRRCFLDTTSRRHHALYIIAASAATFSRFIPEVKARYDYGVTIFILTFSLVAVSSYRVDELIRLAHQRFSTIVVGVGTCLCTTVFVFPVWAGEDLHRLAIGNLNKLAEFFEGT